MQYRRTFLAWLNLTHSWRRLGLAVLGIGFAVLLMTMQIGFRNAMLDSTVAAIEQMNADIVITSAARYTLNVTEQFSRRRLYQARSVAGVAAAYPLYIETRGALLENPSTGVSHPVRVFAFEPTDPALLIPGIAQHQAQLQLPDAALFDTKSKREYGPITTDTRTNLSGQPVRVVGTFALGTDFANDGNVAISAATLNRLFRREGTIDAGLGQVDIGLLKVAPGARVADIKTRLLALLPNDVRVLTKQEFKNQEKRFWARSTPVGVIFGMGTAMGFLVGILFCYQILYTDIADHMAEFATLKAMGYDRRYFSGVVVQQALLLALFGFVPGLAVSALLYWWLGAATGMLLDLNVWRMLLILLLTVGMCLASAALAIRKVLSTDPAELF
jgi:putative ABC transport system permease protein